MYQNCTLKLQKNITNFDQSSELTQSMAKLLKIKIFIISVLFLFTYSSCRKDNFRFPYVIISANIGIYNDLGALNPGGVIIFPSTRFGGVGGLIIYRDLEDNYMVFDAACTYDYQDRCILKSSEDFDELMECPCCKSSFLLSSGANVFQGPAKYPLVQYQSFVDGSVLRVNN